MRQLLKLTSLFFIFATTNFRASSQSMEINGVVKEEIKLKEGKIIVYLPDDIRAGDVISGTAVAEPTGRNEKEKNQ